MQKLAAIFFIFIFSLNSGLSMHHFEFTGDMGYCISTPHDKKDSNSQKDADDSNAEAESEELIEIVKRGFQLVLFMNDTTTFSVVEMKYFYEVNSKLTHLDFLLPRQEQYILYRSILI